MTVKLARTRNASHLSLAGVSLLLFVSCHPWSKTQIHQVASSSPTEETGAYQIARDAWLDDPSATWVAEKQRREKELQSYLHKNRSNVDWFLDGPLSGVGLPYVFYRLLPCLSPEFGPYDEPLSKFGLRRGAPFQDVRTFNYQRGALPVGLGTARMPMNKYTEAAASVINFFDFTGLTKLVTKPTTTVMVANFSCSSCHLGYVNDQDGKLMPLLGAPSQQIDTSGLNAAFNKLFESRNVSLRPGSTSMSGGFNSFVRDVGQCLSAMESAGKWRKDPLFNDIFAEFLTVWKNPVTLPIALQTIIKQYYELFHLLGAASTAAYGKNMEMKFFESTPGMSSGVGSVAAQSALNLKTRSVTFDWIKPQEYTRALPNHPSLVDMMPVYRQIDRPMGNYDNISKSKFYRNLASAVGVTGQVNAIDISMLTKTTEFTNSLPPPVYPFPIDKTRAASGKKLFDTYCKRCHFAGNSEIYTSAKMGGSMDATDWARAMAPTKPESTKLMVDILKLTCRKALPNHDTCSEKDDDIFLARNGEEAGYGAVPLTGVWSTAPYLHNGCVPTLYHLLRPEERPQEFMRGLTTYDTQYVGFSWLLPTPNGRPNLSNGSWIYQLRDGNQYKKGRSCGHNSPATLGDPHWRADDEKVFSLIEYMKTL